MSGLPVLLRGARIRALVVGAGSVASRKVAALLDVGATARVVAPEVADALRELAAARPGRVRLLQREYGPEDIGDANLVVAATANRAVNERVARDADAAGRLVNVADRGIEGSWTSMATHRAGELVIGVVAGGVPSASQRVRDAIAQRFDARYAEAIDAVAAARSRAIVGGERDAWRQLTDELLGADFCHGVESGALLVRLRDAEQQEGEWR